jgi:hypothetical protein
MADTESLPPGTAGHIAANQQTTPAAISLEAHAMSFTSASGILTPMSHHVLAYARQRNAAGEHPFAVVLAQAACEWHTEEALSLLIRHKRAELLGDLVMSLVGETVSLGNPRVRRLYTVLTDDFPGGHSDRKLPAAAWWEAWTKARQLRHDVAHKAKQVSPEQADAAIKAADAYIAHITAVVERVRAVP